MKKRTVLILMVVATVLTVVYLYFFDKLTTKHITPQNVQPTYEVTGVIRNLQLEQEIIDRAFLDNVNFQIVNINSKDQKKLPSGAERLYVKNGDTNLNKYTGKCVTVKGQLDNGWLEKTADLRKNKDSMVTKDFVLIPNSVDVQDFSACEGYQDNSKNTDGPRRILLGKIQRVPRQDPTINSYDYLIAPITEQEATTSDAKNNTAEITFDYIFLVPASNTVWKKLENGMENKIIVEGYEKTGIVNSKYLLVTEVLN